MLVATWLQVILLAVNAVLIWMYLIATRSLAWSSLDQVEVQIRPALVVILQRGTPITFKNVGKGPAIDVDVTPVKRGSDGCYLLGTLNDLVSGGRSFVEVGQECGTRTIWTRADGMKVGGSLYALDDASTGLVESSSLSTFPASLQFQYRSLSGQIYWTVVDFNEDGDRVAHLRFSRQNKRRRSFRSRLGSFIGLRT